MARQSPAHAIELRGITKVLGGQVVHQNLDLTLEPGKTTVVVGSSGAGKSVMLKYILGFMRPDAGDVIVHLFRPEVRSFYNLERMWGFTDAPAAPATATAH